MERALKTDEFGILTVSNSSVLHTNRYFNFPQLLLIFVFFFCKSLLNLLIVPKTQPPMYIS